MEVKRSYNHLDPDFDIAVSVGKHNLNMKYPNGLAIRLALSLPKTPRENGQSNIIG